MVPSVYHPGNVNVPSQAGALLAGIGSTALDVGKQIQQSAINPSVRAQRALDVASANQGLHYLKQIDDAGLSPFITGIDANGRPYTTPLSQVTNPTLAAQVTKRLMDLTGGGGKPQPDNRPVIDQEEQSKTPPAGTPATPTPATPPATATPAGPPSPESMAKPKTAQVAPTSPFLARAYTQAPGPEAFQGPSQAQTTAAVQESLGRNRFASAEQGVPAGYQPPGAGAPQAQAEPGGIMDQYAQGYAQGQEFKRQNDLAAWQQTTQTEPMTADDAMKYIRRKTTLAQDATYLPHGGPNGEPAFAFHMKRGGVNTIPVSQMVKDGAGPDVAAQNTSAVLSQSDRLKQQQQNALAAPPAAPDQGQGAAVAQAQPSAFGLGQTDQLAQQQQNALAAPPAPGQPPSDLTGQVADIARVPSKGGLSPEYLSAQAAPGPPATPPAPAIPTPAQQDAVSAAAKNYKNKAPDQTGDIPIPSNDGFSWYIDNHPDSPYHGQTFAVAPPTSADGYYNQERFLLGKNVWEPYYLKDSGMRDLMQYWVKTGDLTQEKIAKMSGDEMKPWLRAAWQNENMKRTDPNGGLNKDLDTVELFHNGIEQIKDMIKTAQSTHNPLNWWSNVFKTISNAQEGLVGHEAQMAITHGYPNAAHLIERLQQTISSVHNLVDNNQTLLAPGHSGGIETPPVGVLGINVPSLGFGGSDVLNQVFSGRNPDEVLRNLDAYQKFGDQRYRNLMDEADTQWYKVSPRHRANMARMDENASPENRKFNDPQNVYSNHTFPTEGSAAAPQPTYKTPRNQKEYDDIAEGETYNDPILGPTKKGPPPKEKSLKK